MIRRRVLRTGDGSHRYAKKMEEEKNKRNEDIINNNENFNDKIWAHDEGEFPETYWGYGELSVNLKAIL